MARRTFQQQEQLLLVLVRQQVQRELLLLLQAWRKRLMGQQGPEENWAMEAPLRCCLRSPLWTAPPRRT
jgi:hypothetical protein